MKKTLVLIFVTFMLNVTISLAQKGYEKDVLETLLKTNEIVEILDLKHLDNNRGSIRIVDNSKKFGKISFLHKVDSTISEIPYLNVYLEQINPVIPINWNSGETRDLYIYKWKKIIKNTYEIIVYVTTFNCIGPRKVRMSLTMKYGIVDGQVVVISKESSY